MLNASVVFPAKMLMATKKILHDEWVNIGRNFFVSFGYATINNDGNALDLDTETFKTRGNDAWNPHLAVKL